MKFSRFVSVFLVIMILFSTLTLVIFASDEAEEAAPAETAAAEVAADVSPAVEPEPAVSEPASEAPQEAPAEELPAEPEAEEPAAEEPSPAPEDELPAAEEPAQDPAAEDAGEPVASEEPAAEATDAAGEPAEEAEPEDPPVDEYGVSLHPSGIAYHTLRSDDVSDSVAEAGYFPSKEEVLRESIPGVFSASMILWHEENGASLYRIKETTTFAPVFDGDPVYTPRPGDLIYYQTYRSEYEDRVVRSGGGNWQHAGIVAEVGEDYLVTIEGNVRQCVRRITYTRDDYRGLGWDFTMTWIVDVFGDDDEARAAFVDTAKSAWEQSAKEEKVLAALVEAAGNAEDVEFGGFGTWHESSYRGCYQNDTIASGYFTMPAEWCEMFVLWCAFNADIVRTGEITLQATLGNTRGLPVVMTEYPELADQSFSVYEWREDGDYSGDPLRTAVTDAAGFAVIPGLVYGRYHIVSEAEELDVTLFAKRAAAAVCVGALEEAESPSDEAPALLPAPLDLTPAFLGVSLGG